jgi:hypothetical protein
VRVRPRCVRIRRRPETPRPIVTTNDLQHVRRIGPTPPFRQRAEQSSYI